MSDIDKAFTFLSDNVPLWLQQLTEIEKKVSHLRSEMAKVPVSRPHPLKRRTGSIESIRDMDAIMEGHSTSTPGQRSPFASRKRKTPSILSGQGSGPAKYRSRIMIIVQYDGEIQRLFETVVKNISIGRNMLRKGKMAAKLEAMAEMATSDDSDSNSEGDENDALAKISYRHRNGFPSMRTRAIMRNGPAAAANQSTPTLEVFDTTDKSLELAQGLFERAAHQSLRDGDCAKELEAAGNHIRDALDIVTKKNAERAAQKEKEAAKEESKTSRAELLVAKTGPAIQEIQPIVSAAPTTSITMAIEIDDDPDDDDDFVMPPIRLTSRT